MENNEKTPMKIIYSTKIYIKMQTSHNNNLIEHAKAQEAEEQATPKNITQKEIAEVNAKNNEMETKKESKQ